MIISVKPGRQGSFFSSMIPRVESERVGSHLSLEIMILSVEQGVGGHLSLVIMISSV